MKKRDRDAKLKVAVVGASGYAGLELLRILAGHPSARVVLATSDSLAGKKARDVFPHLAPLPELTFRPHGAAAEFGAADVFFTALPHGESFPLIEPLLRSARVIDLSADYRLKNPADYEKWYGFRHPLPALLERSVYGLTEMNRDAVRKAALVANPGCYPTGALLAIAPLANLKGLKTAEFIVDAKSGYTGAGRKREERLLLAEARNEFTAYRVTRHQHCAELLQEAARIFGRRTRIAFTPHLAPVSRGILSTVYARVRKPDEDHAREAFAAFYRGEPFVRVCARGEVPGVRDVAGTNVCSIGVFADADNSLLKIITAIDNLGKGAAGQAVHNMNLMFGLDETAGLNLPGFVP
ncbi:MAG: N-acetyl-gamma-glutamyl-phosphate reductase [bacterium]